MKEGSYMKKIQKGIELLKQHNLFVSVVYNQISYDSIPETLVSQPITQLTYDSRNVIENSVFICKGNNFKTTYLDDALKQGAVGYVSETLYSNCGFALLVKDIRKSMALLAMAYYDFPQEKLKIIGYTGTKGKTTSAFFAFNILKTVLDTPIALLSTQEGDLGDGQKFKLSNTTPESLDLYKMMHDAVIIGTTHLVMEVSSQAYKHERVYGLMFDVGIFLNISPDHISEYEHPDFDDYFLCKRQIFNNSRAVVLNHDTEFFESLKSEVISLDVPLYTYGNNSDVDWEYLNSHHFKLHSLKFNWKQDYELTLEGFYNQSNAVSAILAVYLLTKADISLYKQALFETRIDGRMERINIDDTPVYIDYAHNYLSLDALLEHVKQLYSNRLIKVVIGSTGNKAVTRRYDFAKVLSKHADYVYITSDDPDREDPYDIAKVIQDNLHNTQSEIVIDRKEAIIRCLNERSPLDVIVVAGKGIDAYQIINGVKVPYQGDVSVVLEYKVGYENESKHK